MSYDYRLDKYYDEADSGLNEEFVSQLNTLDRYKDLSEIAIGGMKTIHKAFDQKSQRFIAYATLNKESMSTEAQETFIKEARLTAKLNHPNIIPIYNMGLNEKNVPFFTMELKTGDSLKDIIERLKNKESKYTEKYSLHKLLEIFIKVCDAIAFAHSKKVIHLDIKPDNIQVGSYGEVIVCDWGLSKVYDKQTNTKDINQALLNPDKLNTSTLHGHIKGTPGFMAPEQITGGKKKTQTDIFSLGCLLYSLLGLKAPFNGKDLHEILDNTVNGEYSRLSDIPESIQAVLNKAMKVDPVERYNSVNDLKLDIESFLQGYATQAESASSLKLLKLFILRNKALSMISFISILTIVLVTFTFVKNIQEETKIAEDNLRLFKEQKEETTKAQRDYYTALIETENLAFHSGYKESPIETHKKSVKGLMEIIDTYPDYNEARSALGYHYFVSQQFNKSKEYLLANPGIYSYLLSHIEKYQNLKNDTELLPPKVFTQLLSDISPFKTLHLKMLMYYSAMRNNSQDVIPAVKHILTRLNPDWNSKKFTYIEESQRLTIGGNSFQRLNFKPGGITPIRALKIKALSLRGTKIQSIKSLSDIPIRALDLSDTDIPFFQVLKFEPKGLLRLIITSSQYSPNNLKKLPSIIEIKFSDIKN